MYIIFVLPILPLVFLAFLSLWMLDTTFRTRIRMIQFADGLYGVQSGILYHEYRDLKGGAYWWGKNSTYYRTSCRGQYGDAKSELEALTGKNIIIKHP